MRKYAVIDVGSNSVRLMMLADGKVLYKTLSTTRLGEGLAQTSRLSETAITRTALAVQAFYNRAKEENAKEVYAYATASVRSAENGNQFIEKVYRLCGLQIEVIDGKTEAEIGIIGALGQTDGAIIDVGGASTELAVRCNGQIVYRESINVGVVRLLDTCGRDVDVLKMKTQPLTAGFENAPKLDKVYAIGGTATTLSALLLGLETYSSEEVTGTEITIEQMRGLMNKLSALTVEETEKLPCMPKGRAEVLLGGTVWFVALMERLNLPKIIVSDRDNLEGYAVIKGLL